MASRNNSHSRPVNQRLTTEYAGRIINEIGEHTGIIVRTVRDGDTSRKKYASAHDQRRSCAQRLFNAGISAETLKVVMRHREFSTTERYYGATKRTQSAAAELTDVLGIGCSKPDLVAELVGGGLTMASR